MERDALLNTHWKRQLHFNSHAHVERDLTPPFLMLNDKYFNSHAHVERDLDRRETRPNAEREFQLTRSRGAWQLSKRIIAINENFNSHAHVERDHCVTIVHDILRAFQLTRSRGAWPHIFINNIIQGDISTHTLTWSVTGLCLRGAAVCWHFNSHAHVERDRTLKLHRKFQRNFNSHAHVERDHSLL